MPTTIESTQSRILRKCDFSCQTSEELLEDLLEPYFNKFAEKLQEDIIRKQRFVKESGFDPVILSVLPKFRFGQAYIKDLNFLKEELSIVEDMYPGMIDILREPGQKFPAEIQVTIKNEFETSLTLKLSFKMTISMDYPSGDDHQFEILEFVGMEQQKAESLLKNIKNRTCMVGIMGEGGIVEMAKAASREMEEYEDFLVKLKEKKTLYEERQEELEKKRLEEESMRKEEEKKLRDLEQHERQQKEQEAQKRYDYMTESKLEVGDLEHNTENERIKKQKITMNEHKIDSPTQEQPNILAGLKDVTMSQQDSNSSRFQQDFEDITKLGEGGYGNVFKAKNKMDQNWYAIKRMVLDFTYPKEVKKLLSEVKLLSQLSHPHIVRYYQAWADNIPEDELQLILEKENEEDSSYCLEEEDIQERDDEDESLDHEEQGQTGFDEKKGFKFGGLGGNEIQINYDHIDFYNQDKVMEVTNKRRKQRFHSEQIDPEEDKLFQIASKGLPISELAKNIDNSTNSSKNSRGSESSSSDEDSSDDSSSSSSSSSNSSASENPKRRRKNTSTSNLTNSDLKSSKSHERDSENSFDGQNALLTSPKKKQLKMMKKIDGQSSLKITFEDETIDDTESSLLQFIHKKSFNKSKKSSASSLSGQESTNMSKAQNNRIKRSAKQQAVPAAKMKYLYIQMECCEQNTLKEIIDAGKLKNDEKLFKQLLTQILEALDYVHRNNLIHRDMKPQNIFLDKNNNIKLGDFGLATENSEKPKLASEQQNNSQNSQVPNSRFFKGLNDQPKLIRNFSLDVDVSRGMNLTHGVGTPLYMSPEQAASRSYSGKTDMFALGIILFEMLYAPFSSDTHRIMTLANIRKQEIFIPSDFDTKVNAGFAEFKDLVKNLLNHDPSKRKGSRELFQNFHDRIYQEMVVGDITEYKKIIGYLFSQRNIYDWTILDQKTADSSKIPNEEGSSGSSFNLSFKEVQRSSRVRDFLYRKMCLCFESHHSYQVEVDPIMYCSDIRYLTRFSTRSEPAIFVQELQTSKIQIENMENLYLNRTGALQADLSHNLLIPWSFALNKNEDGFYRVWLTNKSKVTELSRDSYKAWYSLSFAHSRISSGLKPLQMLGLYQAEVLKTCVNSIASIQVLMPEKFKCILSHVGFLELLAIELDIGKESPKYRKLCHLISSYNPDQKKAFEDKLKENLGESSRKIQIISQYISISGKSIQELKAQLGKFINSCTKDYQEKMRSLQQCLVCELEMVSELLKDNWNHDKVALEYGTFYSHDNDFTFHSGIVFSVIYSRVYKGAKNKIKTFRHIIAQGGRFDNTLAAYNHKIIKMNKKSIKTPFNEFLSITGDASIFAPSPEPSISRNQALVGNSHNQHLDHHKHQNTPQKLSDFGEKSWRRNHKDRHLKPVPTQMQNEEPPQNTEQKRKRLKSFYTELPEIDVSRDSEQQLKQKIKSDNIEVNKIYGIGFQLNLDQIETCIHDQEVFKSIGVYDHIYHPLEPNGPSVLIISLSETMINEKFRVCSSLWSMSINVIYKIPPQPADDKLTKECLSLNIKYIVILKPGLYQTDRLRVKNVRKNKEEELTMAGLCQFLRAEIKYRPKSDNSDAQPSVSVENKQSQLTQNY